MTTIAGTRLADLAKDLKMTNAELVTALRDLGVAVTGLSAVLDPDTVSTVRGMMTRAAGQPAARPATRPAAAPAQAAAPAAVSAPAPVRPSAPSPADAQPASTGPAAPPPAAAPAPAPPKYVDVPEDASLRELAAALGVQTSVAQKRLLDMGELVGPNQRLARPLAEKLAAAYGFTLRARQQPKVAPARVAAKKAATAGAAQMRPPVVTIMGHVDHGKTTLLDTIRKANVVAGEHGGITQHIGAYQVEIDHGGEKRKITFLDTPGHKAFTAMRARGASVTDIVVLVVSADDGIMPQTVEAIHHAQSANVPMIVAINKIDLPDANPDRIKQQLTEHNVVVEDYGGDTPAIQISAKTGQGVSDLLEYILLVAEIQELTADPSGPAVGAIVEAKVEPGRGPVATVLVQSGTLKVGDAIAAGTTYGKVRAMTNERGERLQKAGPATPVEIIGLDAAPNAGDTVEVAKSERDARTAAEDRLQKQRTSRFTGTTQRVTLADLFKQRNDIATKDLNVIVKADVQGSLEAVLGQLRELEENKTEEEVRLSVKHSGVGSVNESDVALAETIGAMVIGFNVRTDVSAQRAAERAGVDVRLYNIIYDLVEDVDRAMKGMLTPIYEESPLGKAEVRQVFRTPRGIYIAGCYVTEGKIVRGAEVRVRRGRDVLTSSKIDTLRHVQEDRREIATGFECGLTVRDWNDFQPGDQIECFEMKVVART